MGKSDVPTSFAELIESAQKLPDLLGPKPPDLSSPFLPPVPAGHRTVDTSTDPAKIPGIAEFDYDAHVDYFVLPTQKADYEKTLGLILNGKGLLRYEDRTFTKEGDFV